jgi:hypothetical protein
MKKKFTAVPMAAVSFCWLAAMAASLAHADTMSLDTVFSGTSPVGNSPWVEINGTQQGTNSVQFTVDVPTQTGDPKMSEFVSQIYLNVDPSLTLAKLKITKGSGIEFVSAAVGENAYKADGAGKYDIDIKYPTSGDDRLTTGTSSTFTITYDSSPLSLSAFDFTSTSSSEGAYYAAAHVQGIPRCSESGWVGAAEGWVKESGVPEPSGFVLLLAGAFSLIGVGRWRRAA